MVAPISGVITGLVGEVGDKSTASTQVTIANVDTLYVEIYLDGSDWDKIDLGYNVEVIFDSLPDTTFNGSVIQVDPFLTSSSGATVIGGLVALETEDQALIERLPSRQQRRRGSNWWASRRCAAGTGGIAERGHRRPVCCLYPRQDGEPKLTMVEIGLKDIYYAEVISGLNAGDVVTTGIVETE